MAATAHACRKQLDKLVSTNQPSVTMETMHITRRCWSHQLRFHRAELRVVSVTSALMSVTFALSRLSLTPFLSLLFGSAPSGVLLELSFVFVKSAELKGPLASAGLRAEFRDLKQVRVSIRLLVLRVR